MLSRETRLALVQCKDLLGAVMVPELVDPDDESCDNAVAQLEVDGLATEKVNADDSIGLFIAMRSFDASRLRLLAFTGTMTDEEELTFVTEGMEFNAIIDAFIESH
ncbi:MAG: hypothetical protein AB7J47_09695 [Acidimicrobiia bacterium]